MCHPLPCGHRRTRPWIAPPGGELPVGEGSCRPGREVPGDPAGKGSCRSGREVRPPLWRPDPCGRCRRGRWSSAGQGSSTGEVCLRPSVNGGQRRGTLVASGEGRVAARHPCGLRATATQHPSDTVVRARHGHVRRRAGEQCRRVGE
jgi:hypothetical protein